MCRGLLARALAALGLALLVTLRHTPPTELSTELKPIGTFNGRGRSRPRLHTRRGKSNGTFNGGKNPTQGPTDVQLSQNKSFNGLESAGRVHWTREKPPTNGTFNGLERERETPPEERSQRRRKNRGVVLVPEPLVERKRELFGPHHHARHRLAHRLA